ncbi:hypothetical protein CC2G_013891 [Coprinopsis cinerea AmutBmut pab1-1]|nr:hypothetical protein CC2G_013891 [Coprinopsis cinerea AmutBmut pab1-1]
MEQPQRPLSPRSVRTPSKFSQTFSRFKGIIRIPATTRKDASNDGSGNSDRSEYSKGLENHGPYSRQSIAMKAYMSQPMLARQLLDDNEQERRRQGRHPRQSGDSGESSSSSASPIDDREPSDEFPLPRSSMDPNEPPHDHRRRSRTLSLQSLYRKEASRKESATDAPQNASTGNGRTGAYYARSSTQVLNQLCAALSDKPSADTDPRAQVDRLPPTPPPKSPSLFKRKRSGTNPQQAVPTDSSVPVTASSSQSSTNSGFKSLTKVLVRRASRSRIKTLRPEGESDVPPVPPIPTPFRESFNASRPPTSQSTPQLGASHSGSTTLTASSTTTARPEAAQNHTDAAHTQAVSISAQSVQSVSQDGAPLASTSIPSSITTSTSTSTPTASTQASISAPKPKTKASVASLVSSSGSSFKTAVSTLSSGRGGSEQGAASSKETTSVPPIPPTTHDNLGASGNTASAAETNGNEGGSNGDEREKGKEGKGLKPLRIPMPGRRFSIISSEGTARLSPSLVIRAPPLPILNLPKLPTPTITTPFTSSSGRSGQGTRSGRRGRRRGAGHLRNMPALPLQGSGRGVGGHEEVDDADEDEEEDDDEDEEGEDEDDSSRYDNGLLRPGTSTSDLSDISEGRSSYDLSRVSSNGTGSTEAGSVSSGSGSSIGDAGYSGYGPGYNFGPGQIDSAGLPSTSTFGGATSFHSTSNQGSEGSIKPSYLLPLDVSSSPFSVRFPGAHPSADASRSSFLHPHDVNGKGKNKQVFIPPLDLTLDSVTGYHTHDAHSAATSSQSSSFASRATSDSSSNSHYFDGSHGSVLGSGGGGEERGYHYRYSPGGLRGIGSASSPNPQSRPVSLLASAGHQNHHHQDEQQRYHHYHHRLAISTATTPTTGTTSPRPPLNATTGVYGSSASPGGTTSAFSTATTRGEGSVPSSPLDTPRPEDYRLRASFVGHAPPLVERHSSLGTPTLSSITGGGLSHGHGVQQPNRPPSTMGAALSHITLRLPLPHRPSIYKHASRSLIDLHSIEKREEVERMVREGEEEQEQRALERRRSGVAAKRRSRIAAGGGGGSDGDKARDRDSKVLPIEEDAADPPPRLSILKPAGTPYADGLVQATDHGAGDGGLVTRDSEGGRHCFRPSMGISSDEKVSEDKVDRWAEGVEGGSVKGDSPETWTSTMMSMETLAPGDTIQSTVVGVAKKDASATGVNDRKAGVGTKEGAGSAPAYEEVDVDVDAVPHPLRKRRSMPMFNESSSPPPYPSFLASSHPHPSQRFAHHEIQPREDEGKEELPAYSNAIYLKAILPRKMEFVAPGVQAKDRKWKRVLCVLEGTMLRVYKCPVGVGGVSAIEQWWENKVGAGDVAVGVGAGTMGAQGGTGGGTGRTAGTGRTESVEDEKAKHAYPGTIDAPSTSSLSTTASASVASSSSTSPPDSGSVSARKEGPSGQATATLSRSALNLAVQLLKPSGGSSGKGHSRSHSDVTPPSPTTHDAGSGTRRSSLNLSRSATPLPGHSPVRTESGSSSNLAPPAAVGNSRPVTPTTSSSTRSRFRANTFPRTPRSADPTTFTGKGKGPADVPDPNPEDLIRVYSLQNAESGLGNDYVKRKNVIRVRLEGEQFLLQAKDVTSVVEWIEVR